MEFITEEVDSATNNAVSLKHRPVLMKHVKKDYMLLIGKNCAPYCAGLVHHNYSAISFTSFNKAYQWLCYKIMNNELLPFAILCDIDLPDENVFELFKQIKKNNYLKSVPFLLITDKEKIKDKRKAVKAGFDDLYNNNTNLNDILERIHFFKKYRIKENVYPKGLHQYPNRILSLKRLFDILFSLVALIIHAPIFLVVMVLIKLDSRGPIFYISKRAGSGYKVFNFYKFRTMKVGSDKQLSELTHLNQYTNGNGNGKSVFVKLQNDPRITKLGKFLRNSSLDELPQLLNILKGDMSVVGNRPLPLYEAMQLTTDQWALRFIAPAGLTGLWQITKRGKKDMSEEERISLDCSYAKDRSFFKDLKIILKTIPAMVQKEEV